EVHHQEELVVLLHQVVHGHDGLVPQAGVGAALAAEALDGVLGGGAAGVQGLDGHAAIERVLPRLVDDPHAAAADLANDPARADLAHHRPPACSATPHRATEAAAHTGARPPVRPGAGDGREVHARREAAADLRGDQPDPAGG